jgi:hypothetical protein
MELEEEDDAEAVEDELGVSLHALTGLCATNTIQLVIHVKGKQMRALVDSSSTHSFIHEAVVHAPARVNGERLQSYGICKDTTVDIQGEEFVMDCYTLPLEGFDVILGIQWLKSLGHIVWDFVALSMAFLRQGRSVHLQGCGGGTSTLCSVS